MLKKPTKSSITNAAIDAISATGGGMLSEGVINIIPAKYKADKEELIRGGLALVAAGGAAAIKGTSNQARAIRMGLIGMTIAQVRQIIKSFAPDAGVTKPTEESTTTKKFVAGLFGLSCACDDVPQSMVLARMPRMQLGSPVDFPSATQQAQTKSLVTAFD